MPNNRSLLRPRCPSSCGWTLRRTSSRAWSADFTAWSAPRTPGYRVIPATGRWSQPTAFLAQIRRVRSTPPRPDLRMGLVPRALRAGRSSTLPPVPAPDQERGKIRAGNITHEMITAAVAVAVAGDAAFGATGEGFARPAHELQLATRLTHAVDLQGRQTQHSQCIGRGGGSVVNRPSSFPDLRLQHH